jgi:hypothetical protein
MCSLGLESEGLGEGCLRARSLGKVELVQHLSGVGSEWFRCRPEVEQGHQVKSLKQSVSISICWKMRKTPRINWRVAGETNPLVRLLDSG